MTDPTWVVRHVSKAAADVVDERQRQIEKEGWTDEHDDAHEKGDLALAAICFATPVKLFERFEQNNGVDFIDPWPWDSKWDRRYRSGSAKGKGTNVLPNPSTYSDVEYRDLLVKASALLIAEIEKMDRRLSKNKKHG